MPSVSQAYAIVVVGLSALGVWITPHMSWGTVVPQPAAAALTQQPVDGRAERLDGHPPRPMLRPILRQILLQILRQILRQIRRQIRRHIRRHIRPHNKPQNKQKNKHKNKKKKKKK